MAPFSPTMKTANCRISKSAANKDSMNTSNAPHASSTSATKKRLRWFDNRKGSVHRHSKTIKWATGMAKVKHKKDAHKTNEERSSWYTAFATEIKES